MLEGENTQMMKRTNTGWNVRAVEKTVAQVTEDQSMVGSVTTAIVNSSAATERATHAGTMIAMAQSMYHSRVQTMLQKIDRGAKIRRPLVDEPSVGSCIP
jgi:hypothetical protein